MPDIFDRCVHFRKEQRIARFDELEVLERILFPVLPVQNAGPWILVDDTRVLQFGTNDYLGISVHPAVHAEALRYARSYGMNTPMGARPLTGTCAVHLELEGEIAAYKRKEAALLFSMGAGAMMGAIAGLARPGDLVILDQLAHASLVCGARISGASTKVFKHNNVASLERVLRQADHDQPKLIVVDGVYSMNGDIAPLPEICDLCDQHGARILVDDAHGNGVLGPEGRGTAELLGVEDRVDIHAGTFSKAFGTNGGFLAADQEVIFYLRTLSPTLLFTKSPTACVTAATRVSLELVKAAGERRAVLMDNTDYLQRRLRERGYDIGNTSTPITPIHLGGNTAAHIADILRRHFNVFVPAVFYPAVRRGDAILRAIPTALHTRKDLDYLVDALDRAREQYDRRCAPRATVRGNSSVPVELS